MHLSALRSYTVIVCEKSLFAMQKPKRPNLGVKSHGQPRVIVGINYKGTACPILHIKFHCNRLTGSGEQEFCRVLLYKGLAAILVM